MARNRGIEHPQLCRKPLLAEGILLFWGILARLAPPRSNFVRRDQPAVQVRLLARTTNDKLASHFGDSAAGRAAHFQRFGFDQRTRFHSDILKCSAGMRLVNFEHRQTAPLLPE
jgi:hypothetical protein